MPNARAKSVAGISPCPIARLPADQRPARPHGRPIRRDRGDLDRLDAVAAEHRRHRRPAMHRNPGAPQRPHPGGALRQQIRAAQQARAPRAPIPRAAADRPPPPPSRPPSAARPPRRKAAARPPRPRSAPAAPRRAPSAGWSRPPARSRPGVVIPGTGITRSVVPTARITARACSSTGPSGPKHAIRRSRETNQARCRASNCAPDAANAARRFSPRWNSAPGCAGGRNGAR